MKEILKTERIVYPDSLSRRIIAEIRKTVKSAHKKFEEGEILDRYVNVTVDQEEKLTRKMAHFLEQLRVNIEKVRSKKTAADSPNKQKKRKTSWKNGRKQPSNKWKLPLKVHRQNRTTL